QVDHALVPVAALIAVPAVFQCDDAPIPDGDRRRDPALRVHRVDLAVHEDEIAVRRRRVGGGRGVDPRLRATEDGGETGRSRLEEIPARHPPAGSAAILAHHAPPRRVSCSTRATITTAEVEELSSRAMPTSTSRRARRAGSIAPYDRARRLRI